jgi:hypothetical protein
MSEHIDHDQIFKTLIEAFFQEFMELFCPEESALIDFKRVEFLRQEQFTDTPLGDRRYMDMVAKVWLKEGGERFVLVHTELESSRGEPDFPNRMFRYFCQLYLRYNTAVIPIAVFSDDAHWDVPVPDRYEVGFAGKTVMPFTYHLIKLKHLNYRSFVNSGNPLALALMAKMDYNRKEQVGLKADFLRWILGAPMDSARRSLLVHFVETYMPLTEPEQLEFDELVATDPEYVEVKEMITEYEKKGIEKGRQEALLLLLGRRFGSLPEAVTDRVRRIRSAERLDALLLAVLDAKSLDDLPF